MKVLKPIIYSTNALLYIFAVWKKAIPNLGYARHWKVANAVILKLPTYENGEIAFEFMEKYILNLKNQSAKFITMSKQI